MEKELQKLEKCASKISKVLQDTYDLDEYSADTYALLFIETNFKRITPSKTSVVLDVVKDWLSYRRYSWGNTRGYNMFLGTFWTLVVLTVLSLVIFGISRLPDPNSYKAIFSENYELSTWQQTCKEGICISKEEAPAFTTKFKELENGQAVEMHTTHKGMTVLVRKENGQVIVERKE